MPRPKTREGNSEQLCIKVSIALLEEIDAARGEQSRPDWGRNAFLAALGHPPGYAGTVHGIGIITDERMPPGTAALVSRDSDAVAVSAFALAADEPEPERPRRPGKGPCVHRVQAGAWCKRCGHLI
jgi:hypothetical protein